MKRRARIIRRRLRFGPTIARFFALVILTILAVIALTSSTGNATRLYEKSDLVKDKAKLDTEVEELMFWAKRQQSFQQIDKPEIKDQLVPIDNPDYINNQ
ncbi:MAG: hypothetical protein UT11_C0071G0003 [Berkelbacteria bacterium GW2011_GWA2_38_9]|uniref:Uncharacterized protein n=1 Tax=Berkelbacteria bacterium GW2011_GWA2_38_9 TaxID=1618334 RepID=A0A0G0NKJ0_9BACT|nr:MAG: hypothetical protein UT11_C0071G0003 [Berkelbacteria bacterium GW2011_GWA2_38_9]